MSGVIGFVLGVCVWPFALTVAGAVGIYRMLVGDTW